MTTQELLKAAAALSADELDHFAADIEALRAQRHAPARSREEDLLRAINQRLAAPLQRRWNELVAKRRAETLTPAEHQELIELTSQVERFDTQRARCLVELAALRNTDLSALLDNLGIQA